MVLAAIYIYIYSFLAESLTKYKPLQTVQLATPRNEQHGGPGKAKPLWGGHRESPKRHDLTIDGISVKNLPMKFIRPRLFLN